MDISVRIIQRETKGFAIAESEGTKAGEMTYSVAGPELIIIDHTDVMDGFQGKGVGRIMLIAIVEKARKEEFKILPLCPFAKSRFDKDESIRDVLS
ncbi:MAG: GNAT family N-acetyltransferase [Flavobacteriales bacterium]|nr:GNAT family N-acetyltransferase [Flavobacteriales bacterium]